MRLYSLMCVTLFVVLASQRSIGQETLSVDSEAPSFTLKDQDGKQRSLDDLVKAGNVALVFYRSASW
ncbi:MAG: hypothetical protein CMJ64_26735 [Planctomycetaceae bacterium]|nr:hypothetical protein [Planctomycetaceae bacterium]